MLSDDGEFEKESISQDDLHTSSGLSSREVGESPALSFNANSIDKKSTHAIPSKPPHSTDNKNSNDVSSDISRQSSATENVFGQGDDSDDSTSALESVISPMVHSRTLLLLPLLYMALMPDLWWPLQVAAHILLIFVLLTLAVRLTSSPPRMFTKATTEIKLKDIYEQSRTLLSQEHEEIEHSPGSQSTLGAVLLVAVLIALAYLQATGSLQHFVEEMTVPAVIVPDSGLSPAPVSSEHLLDMCSPAASDPEFPQECLSCILDDCDHFPRSATGADTVPFFFARTKERVKYFLDMLGPGAAIQSGEGQAFTTTEKRERSIDVEEERGGRGDDAQTQQRGEEVYEDGISGGHRVVMMDSPQFNGISALSSDSAPSSGKPRLSRDAERDVGKSDKDTPVASSAKDSATPNITTTANIHLKDNTRGYSSYVGVDTGNARQYLTPVGVDFLVPGSNVTFCAPPFPPRASIWNRIFRRHKRDANDEAAVSTGGNPAPDSAAAVNTNETDCLLQVLTVDVSGFVMVRKVTLTAKSDPDLTTTTTTTTKTVSISQKSRNKYNIVWKGNLFPLWKRALKKLRLKRLPSASLPYSLTNTTLTIWKAKKRTDQKLGTEGESSTGQNEAAGEDEWMRVTKPWKVFQVQAD